MSALRRSSKSKYSADLRDKSLVAAEIRLEPAHLGAVHSCKNSLFLGAKIGGPTQWGVTRLIVNRRLPLLLRPHPGTRAPSLHRNYPASSVLRAPPPPVYGQTPEASGGRADRQPPQTGFPCCPMLLVDMLSPTTPAKRIEPVVQFVRSMPVFPQSRQGRPSHRVFRGRLGVHTYYGLPTCRRPNAAFFLPGSDHFVTSMAAGIATRPGRPLPGQDFHLLEHRTFTAHLDQHTSSWIRESGSFPDRTGSCRTCLPYLDAQCPGK